MAPPLDLLLLQARAALQRAVDRHQIPPRLLGVASHYDEHRDALRFRASFDGGVPDRCWEVQNDLLLDAWRDWRLLNRFERACRELYAELVRAEFGRRQAAATMTVHRSQGFGFVEERQPPELVEAPNMTATEVDRASELYARAMNARVATAMIGGPEPPSEATLNIEAVRRAMRHLERESAAGLQREHEARMLAERVVRARLFGDLLAFGNAVLDPDADARGLALLKAWLSPAQREQFESQKWFEVTGSITGDRYRIKHGVSMNVEQIDGAGRPVCGWCFVPEGGLVAGDVMLAQKVALETDEAAAMKVARAFVPTGSMQPGAVNYIAAANAGPNWFERLFQLGS